MGGAPFACYNGTDGFVLYICFQGDGSVLFACLWVREQWHSWLCLMHALHSSVVVDNQNKFMYNVLHLHSSDWTQEYHGGGGGGGG